MMKDHQRGGPYPILQYLGALRHKPLRRGQAVEHIRALAIELHNMRAHALIFYKVCIEILAQHVLRDIIVGGT